MAAFLLAGVLAPSPGRAQDAPANKWVSTWGAATSSTSNDGTFATNSYNGNNVFDNQTVRLTVHASLGGSSVRVRLSNQLDTQPVTLGAVHIALSDTTNNIIADTDRTLTFNNGNPSVTIPADTPEISDPVSLDVPANAKLAISIYFPTETTVVTGHPVTQQRTYISPPGSGDVTAMVSLPLDGANPLILQWPLLNGVEVRARGARTFVALGSSITNGNLSTLDANHRWTDYLAQRFTRRGLPVGVVNASIIASALQLNGNGGPALARFDRDVIARPGVAYVFINDILGVELQGASAASDMDVANGVIGGLHQYLTRAHARGIAAYAGTIIPLGGATGYTPVFEARRQLVNAFIRGGGLDGYVDFDAAVRDPADPTRILPAYDGGDHHHLNDAGYKVMADAFDLALFQ